MSGASFVGDENVLENFKVPGQRIARARAGLPAQVSPAHVPGAPGASDPGLGCPSSEATRLHGCSRLPFSGPDAAALRASASLSLLVPL